MINWLDWAGATAVVVASGASAKDAWIEAAKGKARVLVINDSWRLAPWADALYACDLRWWRKESGAAEFNGERITQDARAAADYGLRKVTLERRDEILTETPGVLGWGGNGGFHALNLAVQAGAKRIVLMGYDLVGEHWHGRHPAGLNNPTPSLLAKWAKVLDAQAPRLAALGVEVLNASPRSALTAYPRVPLEAAI